MLNTKKSYHKSLVSNTTPHKKWRYKDAHVDDQHLGRTPSNFDPNIVHHTLPLPGPHRSILNSFTPRTLDAPISLELSGGRGLIGKTRGSDNLTRWWAWAGSWDSSRGQGLEHALATRRVFPNEHLLDRNTDLSLQRDLECRFFTILQIEIPRGCHELEEERDFVRDAEGRDRRYE
jgi:hypothetical protein